MIEPYQRDKSLSSVARLLVGVSHDNLKLALWPQSTNWLDSRSLYISRCVSITLHLISSYRHRYHLVEDVDLRLDRSDRSVCTAPWSTDSPWSIDSTLKSWHHRRIDRIHPAGLLDRRILHTPDRSDSPCLIAGFFILLDCIHLARLPH